MRLLVIILFLTTYLIEASNDDKILNVKKTTEKIEVDGLIDPAWKLADTATNFFQLQPYYAKEPAHKTIAKVLTDERNIYCLMLCYDDPDNIKVTRGLQDDKGGDVVSFMVDTFNDNQNAYKFAVNAAGVRSDCKMVDDGRNRDYNWDGIWFANAKVYDWGFAVEMKIPYKSIQYDPNAKYWGLDFDRWNPERAEDLYWCEYDQNEGQRISKFGKMIFQDFEPSLTGLNLEASPVGMTKAEYIGDNKYDVDADAGIDVFYNPSSKLTYQLTANPDFAQIEADPYDFNISRYESYFSERRPFFTEGNEVFMASGKQRNTGFYSPLVLFYSRRIGKKLPNGEEVPIIFGTKAFGKLKELEYGGFMAMTGETDYTYNGEQKKEPRAYYGVGRIKKKLWGSSSMGVLFAGKHTENNDYGVLDIDGGLRGSNWQLAYQLARSFKNDEGDYAFSAGLTSFRKDMVVMVRSKHIGSKFDISEIGYVPWQGKTDFVGGGGPIWFYDSGSIRQILLVFGGAFDYTKEDDYLDKTGLLVFNMQFTGNWGFEVNLDYGKAKDLDVKYNSYSATLSTWFHPSPNWNGNVWAGYSKTYNFSRDYLAYYSWLGSSFEYQPFSTFNLGTSFDMWLEGNPQGNIEDITYNARPYFNITPFNNLNFRVYVDNLFIRSTDRMERIIGGFLFSYNFSPKSWIYLAINEVRDRDNNFAQLKVTERASVLKIKYLYYF